MATGRTLSPIIMLCLALLLAATATARPEPKHQVRAVWLTTAYGLDWPMAGSTDQKESLRTMLDVLADVGINTVMFQCRIRGDVAYDSAIEPRNPLFAGMDFDPLAFAVDECHKLGMECHAWMVCIPLGKQGKVPKRTLDAIARTGSGLVMTHGRQLYLDPSRRGTGEYLARIAAELTSRYDIDGLHLDYIRYPDDYRAFPKAKGMTAARKAAARREHITGIVRRIHTAVKSVKPWVSLSCATIGKLRSTSRLDSRGWDARDCLGQDVQRWLGEGLVDAVYPMMYYKDGDFYPFAADWSEAVDGCRVIPALGLYRIEYWDQGWDAAEIVGQALFCEALGLGGIGLYRAKTLTDNTRNICGLLRGDVFRHKALPRHGDGSARMDSCTVTLTRVKTTGRRTRLQWECRGAASEVTFTIYASDTWPVDTGDPANIIETGVKGGSYTYDYTYDSGRRAHFAVTATDRFGNESAPAATPRPDETHLGVMLPSLVLGESRMGR